MGVMKRKIPAEITSYKEKFFFGLTVRQLICGAGILALAIPTGIFGSKFFTQDTVGWIILIEVVPLAAIGFKGCRRNVMITNHCLSHINILS